MAAKTPKVTETDIAELDYLRGIAAQLQTAGHGSKGAITEQAMAFLKLSRAELYRRLESVGYVTERKTRSDKGKSVVSEQAAQLIGGLVSEATRANGKRTTSIKSALKIAKANGLAPDVSAATISRAMLRHHCHPTLLEMPTAHIQQRSLHPNHVWQIDASTCILFYLPKEGGIRDMNPREFNKNKPENLKRIEKDMVTRYVITDHYSSSVYVEYVRGGESSLNLIKVLLNCMQRRGDQNPMHGVPFIIYTDKGSAMTSKFFTNLIDRLDIEIIDHSAGNARAKGQVENHQNIVERNFEGRIKFLKDKITTLKELNDYAFAWCKVFNETEIHTRTKQTRNAVWQTITAQHLRKAPPLELCEELVTTEPEERPVTNYLTVNHAIRGYGTNSYDVRHIPGVYPKAKLLVVVNPYRAPAIDVITTDDQGIETVYTLEPRQQDLVGWHEDMPIIGQEMKSLPETPVDQARKQIRKAAYAVETEEELAHAIKTRQNPYAGQIDPMADISQTTVPSYLPRAGGELATPATESISSRRTLAPISHVEAAKRIKALIGDLWDPSIHFAVLLKTFPESVPVDVIEDIADGIRAEANPKPQTLRVVGI